MVILISDEDSSQNQEQSTLTQLTDLGVQWCIILWAPPRATSCDVYSTTLATSNTSSTGTCTGGEHHGTKNDPFAK